jgi:phospholipid-binding lipoprotein MlaA
MTSRTTKLRNRMPHVVLSMLLLMLSACATVDPEYADPRDPLESFNRSMFTFNDNLDQYVAKPLARGYKKITPEPIDRGITNFFSNLDEVGAIVNNSLQLKFKDAASDLGRLAVNSTLGLLGFMDVASGMGLQKHNEDFGQTLGAWGIKPGPYLVLPVIGPSSGRDAVGFTADWFTNPLYYVVEDVGVSWGLYLIRFVDRRAGLLKSTDLLETAALDPYAFMRESYLQYRLHQVYDGNPPLEDIFTEE